VVSFQWPVKNWPLKPNFDESAVATLQDKGVSTRLDAAQLENGCRPTAESCRLTKAVLHSSEYQTRQSRAGCAPGGKQFGYAFFEAPFSSK
jgi:hypothetical protein